MKRILTMVLALLMVIGVMAGCAQNPTPTTPTGESSPAATAQDAIDYLKNLYKDDGSVTAVNYQRYNVVRIAGVPFPVEWTLDVGEDVAKITPNDKDEISIIVDVNEACTQETEYTLTATVTDASGATATHSWKHILPAAVDMVSIVKEAYALESGASMDHAVTLTGKIIAVNTPYDDGYMNVTVTIAVPGIEDKPIMCYRLKGEGAELIDNGWVITVTGIIKNYNGTIEFDSGCTLDKYVEGEGAKAPEDPTQIVDEAYALDEGGVLPYTATLTGVVSAIDSAYSPEYKNVSVVIKVDGREDKPILCYRMKGDGADQVMPGDTITVTGSIKNHKGTIEFDANCILKSFTKGENSFELPDTELGIVKAGYALGVGESFPVPVTLTGLITRIDDVYSERYGNITVTMVVDNRHDMPITCYRLKGEDADKIWEWDTITVSGLLKNHKGSVQFDSGCTLESWEDTGKNPYYPKNSVEAVETLYNMEPNTTYHGMYSITGRVTEADPYELNYGNQTLVIAVPGAEKMPVTCYRMTTGGIMDIAAGDYVTVRGNLENYKGYKQLTNGYLTWLDQTTLAEAIEEVKGLASGEKLSYAKSMTGTIEINTPYSADNKVITFTITDSKGNSIKAYGIKGYGADQLVDGDVVTVTGKLQNYNGEAQFPNDSTFICERLLPKTFADQYEAAKTLANNVWMPIESSFTGVVIDPGKWDSDYKNRDFTLKGEVDGVTYEILCFQTGGTGFDKLNKGDTVSVSGPLTAFHSVPQFKWADAVIVKKAEVESNPGTGSGTIPDTFAEQMEQAVANGENDYESTLTAVVTVYKQAGRDAGHHRFVISDGTVTIECYFADCGDYVPAVGDTVKVTGKLSSYDGNAQFPDDAKCVLVKKGEGTTPDPKPDTKPGTEVKLQSGEYILSVNYNGNTYYAGDFDGNKGFAVVTDKAQAATYTITVDKTAGTATIFDGANYYGHTSGNVISQLSSAFAWTVTENADGTYSFSYIHSTDGERYIAYNNNTSFNNPLLRCYKASSLNGTYAADYSNKFVLSVPGSTDPDQGGTTDPDPDTKPEPDLSTLEKQIEAANALENDAMLSVESTIQGTVVITNDYSAEHGNITFEVTNSDKNTLTCFRVAFDGMEELRDGAIVKVTGHLYKYYDGVEFHGQKDTVSVTLIENGPVVDPGESGLNSFELVFDGAKANRVSQNKDQQVWQANDITFTNKKSSSTTNVADYGNPVRLYKDSSIQVDFANMVQIDFVCNSSIYAETLAKSFTGATVSGKIVTVKFDASVDTFTIDALSGQVRVNSITVYTAK